ncbi:hypothetical protein QQF64_022266 [Cirrhinus molitorella]|uniref:non-specific serine/threonine protein kinase n=1 Tax=Cirrhinus molitorella TaxID=172907 RepID=A0ABR3L7V5_9TELE
MGQRSCRRVKAERGVECVDGVNPRTTLTPTDHTAELHPRPDETPVCIGEGGQERRKGETRQRRRGRKRGGLGGLPLSSVVCLAPNPPKLRVSRWSEEDQGTDGTPPRRCTDDPICWTYAIGEKLGEGECGSVYAGSRIEDGLQVAMKFTEKDENEPYLSLPDHPSPVPAEVALTVMANQGPRCRHIVKLLDWQDEPDHYIMVLEHPSPCMDMHDFWEQHGDLFSEPLVRHFMQQAIEAAVVCCSRGVFHRDIKMANLLVNTETMEVKLIDFGVGDLLKSSPYIIFSGTANYCPPEYFAKGEYHGKEATVWSLGVLLFTMMANRYP